jgi:hypothetical protein
MAAQQLERRPVLQNAEVVSSYAEPASDRPSVYRIVLTLGAATTAVMALIVIIGFVLGELQVGGAYGVAAVDGPTARAQRPFSATPPPMPRSFAIAIHGGAGTIIHRP